MRHARILAAIGLALAVPAWSQQPKAPAPTTEPPLEIYQIDLVPSGTGFALTKPVLQGDVYVFQVWPDRATVRLPKAKVKSMVARTKDVSGEFLYQIDLAPTGQMFSRDEPVSKGGTYQFHTWREGTLMSLRPGDVKKITRLTGLDAFKIHMQQLGAKQIGNLAMQGGGSATVVGGSAPADAAHGSASMPASQTPYNWIYQGVPGVTDAWAPPSAVVASPGDVPKAAEPHW
ncbi:MAG TPA: hypothetical protein VMQ61_05260 [Thermoanaerobaculia bacterium]|nr:hypothetical protein [Thermoanaerobaculia bacterium]